MSRRLPRVRKLLLHAGWLLALLWSAGAQPLPAGSHRFEHVDFDDGLPGSFVTSIIQRSDGYVWIGTDSGVSRYDGTAFRNLEHEAADPRSLSGSWIRDLVEDAEGRLWVATDKGANREREDRSGFERFLHDPGNPRSLPGDVALTVFRDRSGTMWVGTDAGLARYRSASGDFDTFRPPDTTDPEAQAVRVLIEDARGELWVGTQRGLLRFDRDSERFMPADGDSADAAISRVLADGYFARALLDRSGTLWFAADRDGGLLSRDPQGRWRAFRHDPANPRSLPDDAAWSLAEDGFGRIWVGTWGHGLAVLDAAREGFTAYRANDADELALPHDFVTDILVDASGLVWVGTGSGAATVTPNSDAIRHFVTIPGDASSLPDRLVWSIRAAADGSVFVGGEKGLARLAADGETLEPWPAGDGGAPDSNDGTIWAVEPDPAGGAWLGTDGGLAYFDPRSRSLRKIDGGPDGVQRGREVYTVDRTPEGDLWIAQRGVGLVRLSADARAQQTIGIEQGLPTLEIQRSLLAQDGGLWYGGVEGLFAVDTATLAVRRVTGGPDAALLARAPVNGISQDPRSGRLWISCNDLGVFEVDPGRRGEGAAVVRRITTANGLPSDRVLSTLADDRGHLWFATGAGLSSLDPETGVFAHFGFINESRKLQFSENVAARARDGSLLFGGTRGFVHFRPENLQPSSFEPPVYFTSVRTAGRRGEQSIVDRVPDRLELPYDVHEIELDFAALDYAQPNRNRYRYRLLGRDEQWSEPAQRNRIELRHLPRGRHLLELQGTNRDGLWSAQLARMELSVAPPPWLTPAAYLAYATALLIAFALIASGMRRRAANQMRIAASERLLSAALWGSGDELWEWNVATGNVTRKNLLPILPPPDAGQRAGPGILDAVLHPEDVEATQARFERVDSGAAEEFEALYRLRGIDGEWVWLLDRGRIVERLPDGRPARVAGTLRNVDAIMRTERRLHLIGRALEQSQDGVLVYDTDFRVVYANHAVERYMHAGADALPGKLLDRELFRITPPGVPGEEFERGRAAFTSGLQYRGEFECSLADGTVIPVAVTSSVIRDDRGTITHAVTFMSDITARKQAENALRRLASFDNLTGLPNRALFLDRLEQAILHARRNGTRVALMFIDLDHFKHVNDSLGHAAGDDLLRTVAARLSASVRDADTVARLGGDEFTIIVDQPANDGAVATVAAKLIEALGREIEIGSHSVRVSPSIGIAQFPVDGEGSEELLMCSDIAMYHAKTEGRNNFQFFRPTMNQRVLERIALEKKLRQALADDVLELHYQPKIDAVSGAVCGLEALLRWTDAELGVVSPAQFIPVAEESGLIVTLGRWVLRTACVQASRWLADGLDPGVVAVNLSVRQFRDRDLVDDVSAVLRSSALPPERLELEITESTLANDIDYAIRTLRALRALGVRLALDDFGTGFSSLSYLRRFPIHTLKLDRSFLHDVPGDRLDSRLVEGIIGLAHDLGLSVTAEGIEQQAQWDFLRDCGCEYLQGYLCARPMSADKITERLQTPGA